MTIATSSVAGTLPGSSSKPSNESSHPPSPSSSNSDFFLRQLLDDNDIFFGSTNHEDLNMSPCTGTNTTGSAFGVQRMPSAPPNSGGYRYPISSIFEKSSSPLSTQFSALSISGRSASLRAPRKGPMLHGSVADLDNDDGGGGRGNSSADVDDEDHGNCNAFAGADCSQPLASLRSVGMMDINMQTMMNDEKRSPGLPFASSPSSGRIELQDEMDHQQDELQTNAIVDQQHYDDRGSKIRGHDNRCTQMLQQHQRTCADVRFAAPFPQQSGVADSLKIRRIVSMSDETLRTSSADLQTIPPVQDNTTTGSTTMNRPSLQDLASTIGLRFAAAKTVFKREGAASFERISTISATPNTVTPNHDVDDKMARRSSSFGSLRTATILQKAVDRQLSATGDRLDDHEREDPKTDASEETHFDHRLQTGISDGSGDDTGNQIFRSAARFTGGNNAMSGGSLLRMSSADRYHHHHTGDLHTGGSQQLIEGIPLMRRSCSDGLALVLTASSSSSSSSSTSEKQKTSFEASGPVRAIGPFEPPALISTGGGSDGDERTVSHRFTSCYHNHRRPHLRDQNHHGSASLRPTVSLPPVSIPAVPVPAVADDHAALFRKFQSLYLNPPENYNEEAERGYRYISANRDDASRNSNIPLNTDSNISLNTNSSAPNYLTPSPPQVTDLRNAGGVIHHTATASTATGFFGEVFGSSSNATGINTTGINTSGINTTGISASRQQKLHSPVPFSPLSAPSSSRQIFAAASPYLYGLGATTRVVDTFGSTNNLVTTPQTTASPTGRATSRPRVKTAPPGCADFVPASVAALLESTDLGNLEESLLLALCSMAGGEEDGENAPAAPSAGGTHSAVPPNASTPLSAFVPCPAFSTSPQVMAASATHSPTLPSPHRMSPASSSSSSSPLSVNQTSNLPISAPISPPQTSQIASTGVSQSASATAASYIHSPLPQLSVSSQPPPTSPPAVSSPYRSTITGGMSGTGGMGTGGMSATLGRMPADNSPVGVGGNGEAALGSWLPSKNGCGAVAGGEVSVNSSDDVGPSGDNDGGLKSRILRERQILRQKIAELDEVLQILDESPTAPPVSSQIPAVPPCIPQNNKHVGTEIREHFDKSPTGTTAAHHFTHFLQRPQQQPLQQGGDQGILFCMPDDNSNDQGNDQAPGGDNVVEKSFTFGNAVSATKSPSTSSSIGTSIGGDASLATSSRRFQRQLTADSAISSSTRVTAWDSAAPDSAAALPSVHNNNHHHHRFHYHHHQPQSDISASPLLPHANIRGNFAPYLLGGCGASDGPVYSSSSDSPVRSSAEELQKSKSSISCNTTYPSADHILLSNTDFAPQPIREQQHQEHHQQQHHQQQQQHQQHHQQQHQQHHQQHHQQQRHSNVDPYSINNSTGATQHFAGNNITSGSPGRKATSGELSAEAPPTLPPLTGSGADIVSVHQDPNHNKGDGGKNAIIVGTAGPKHAFMENGSVGQPQSDCELIIVRDELRPSSSSSSFVEEQGGCASSLRAALDPGTTLSTGDSYGVVAVGITGMADGQHDLGLSSKQEMATKNHALACSAPSSIGGNLEDSSMTTTERVASVSPLPSSACAGSPPILRRGGVRRTRTLPANRHTNIAAEATKSSQRGGEQEGGVVVGAAKTVRFSDVVMAKSPDLCSFKTAARPFTTAQQELITTSTMNDESGVGGIALNNLSPVKMQMGDSPSPSRREELLQGRRGASYDSCLLSSSISSLADRRQRLQDVVGCDVVRHAQFRSSGSLSASDFVDTSAGCLPTKLMAAASAEEPKLLPPPGVDVCHDQQAGRSAHNNNLKHNGMVATGSRVPLLATTSTPKRVLSGRGVAAHHQQELCVKFNGGAAASSSLRANALDVTFDVAIEAPPSSSAARSRRNTNDSRRSSYDGSSVGGVRTHRFASQGSGFLMDSLVGGAYLSGSKGEDTFADYSPRPHQHDNHQPSSGHHQHHPLTETSLKSAIEHLRRHQQQQQLQRIRSRDSRMTSSSSAHQLLRQSSALSRTLSGRGLVFTGTVAGGGATSRSSVNSRSAERLQGGGDYFEHVMDNMGDHDGEGDMVKRASSNALLTMASEGGASSNCEIVSLLFSDGEELYSGAREGAGIRGTIRAATMPERDGVELHLEAELLQSEDEEDTQTALHNAGLCKPCAFYYSKKTGCRNADSCEFCHHKDHARLTLKQWKKRQQKLVKQGNTTTELSGATTDGTTTTPPANGIPATASPAVDPSAPPASSSSSSTSAAPPDLAAVNTSPTARPEPETTTASMMTSTTSTMTNPNHQGFGQEEPSNHSSPFPNPTPADAKYDDNAGTPVAGYTVGINTGGIHTGGVILPAGMGMDAGKGHASLLGFSSGGVESAWPNSLGSGMYHHAAGGVYAAGGQGLPPMAPPYHHPPHLHRHPHRPHHRHPHHPHHHHHHQNQFSSISSSSGQQGLPSSDLPPSPHGWTPLGTDHSFSPPASRPVLPPVSSGAFGGYGGVDPHMSMVAGYESGGAAGYDDQQQYNINGSMFPPGGMHSRANLGVRMAGLSPAGSSGNFATQQSPGRNANIDRVMQQSPAVFREVWGNGGADGHRYHHGVLPPVGGQPPPPPPNQLHFEGDGRMSHHQRLFFKDARGINTGDDITGRNTTAGGMELRVHYPQQHQPFQTNVNDLSLSNVLHGAGGVSHLVPAHRKGFSTGAVNSPPGMSGGGGIYTAPPPNFSSRNQHSGRMVAGGGRMAHPAPPLPLTPPAAASGGLPQFSTCQQHQQPPVQHQQKKWHNDQLRQHQQHQHQPANRPRGGREGDQQIKSPSSASRSTTTSTTSYAAAVAAPPSSPSVSSELN